MQSLKPPLTVVELDIVVVVKGPLKAIGRMGVVARNVHKHSHWAGGGEQSYFHQLLWKKGKLSL